MVYFPILKNALDVQIKRRVLCRGRRVGRFQGLSSNRADSISARTTSSIGFIRSILPRSCSRSSRLTSAVVCKMLDGLLIEIEILGGNDDRHSQDDPLEERIHGNRDRAPRFASRLAVTR